MKRYTTRPIAVEAEQFDGTEASAKSILTHFFPDVRAVYEGVVFARLMAFKAPSGETLTAGAGAWFVRHPSVGVLAFTPDVFADAFVPA